MNKKQILTNELKTVGIKDPVVRWITKNPMGRKNKTTGWIYREASDTLWTKLGENFESAKAQAQNLDT